MGGVDAVGAVVAAPGEVGAALVAPVGVGEPELVGAGVAPLVTPLVGVSVAVSSDPGDMGVVGVVGVVSAEVSARWTSVRGTHVYAGSGMNPGGTTLLAGTCVESGTES